MLKFVLLTFFNFIFILFTDAIAEEINPLIFMHIPKTGGITVLGNLTNRIPLNHTDLSNTFFSTHQPLFNVYHQLKNRNIKLSNCRFITFLRHPVERVLSEHFFCMVKNHGDPACLGAHGLPPGDPLYTVCNNMCKMLSGLDLADKSITDATHLHFSKAALKDFFFVGITEKMDESIAILFNKLDWPAPEKITPFNVTKRDEQISPQILKNIAERNWADLELYQYAEELFEKEKQTFSSNSKSLRPITFYDSYSLQFDQPLNGCGWASKFDGIYQTDGVCRWVDYQNEASIVVYLKEQIDYDMKLQIIINPILLNYFTISINQSTIDYLVTAHDKLSSDEPIFIECCCEIPQALIKDNEPTRLTFTLTKPMDLYSLQLFNSWEEKRAKENCQRGHFACKNLEIKAVEWIY